MVHDDRSMPLTGHLDELRNRLIRSLLAIFIVFLPAYFFANVLFDFLAQPLHHITTDPHALIGTSPTEAFFTKIKVAFIAALFGASPAIFYQLWQFVAPGLYPQERRYVWPFVIFCSFFFVLGAGFCYTVVLPIAYAFFLGEFRSIGVQATLKISEYLTFTARTLLAFGVTFELPVLAFFFARVGLITHHTLIGAFRYAAVGVFILAAILTPPDAISQMLLAVPLLLLYVLSIGVAYVFGKKKEASEGTEFDSTDE